MNKVREFLKGKKTYCVAIAAIICAELTRRGIVIPEEAWAVMGALGLAFVRAGVDKIKAE